jgi:hypothetical protein
MKSKKNLILWGSRTAKAGFSNEDDIVAKFNNWKEDHDAKIWLELMCYKLDEIEKLEAGKLHGYKTDIQVQITIRLNKAISTENISIKLVSNNVGFNQIDKRWVKSYVEMWNIPEDVTLILQKYTGESKSEKQSLRDPRRMFFDEMLPEEVEKVIKFFNKNKVLIVSDLIKGKGVFSANWMLVALKLDNEIKWVLKSISYAMNVFSKGDVCITKQGNLRIGKIGMQRKGGDNGRDTAKMLQFKANPLLLFDSESKNI